ncbi:TonB-dependent receptor family protein [Flagellimonas nanhaiensis]|uniref:TonB-dependent receptor n=1 Tax=Flagellimonas nanhaiensis TaxID=2292706 RepID=A0A371JQ04_9FLAO|nr:TonB-dependent receptor [Allomuricauda nanhaiensis]RDY59590.1 TonB-dependent receptor [Allomuricauda nanhaiensis]
MKIFRPFLFIFFTTTLVAQEVQLDSVTQLDEVIVLEDAVPKKATGITASSIVGPSTFEKFNPVDIASAINQISGVYILSGALNTNRITIRGVGARTPFGTDKLRLYFNGIPVTNGTGSSTIEAFDFENLGAVEVIKGPKGTTFGGNLGGAVLLNTLPSETNLTRISNSFTIGSYNMLKDNLSFSHQEKNFNLRLSYNHLETDGFRQNNGLTRDGVLLNTNFNLNAKSELGILINYIDFRAHIPSSLNQTDFSENPRLAAANWLAARGFEDNKYTLTGLYHNWQITDKFKNTTSIFYTYLDHYEPRPFNILDEITNGYGFRSLFEGNWGTFNYSFGGELYKDEYEWSTYRNLFRDNDGDGSLQGNQLSQNKEFRTQLNLFGTLMYPFTEDFSVQLGLGFNQTDYDFRDLFNTGDENTSAERNFDPILLPSVGLQYQFEKGQLYANASRGFSNPSLEETLTPDGIINPDIAQETGMSYELGGQWRPIGRKLSLGLALYHMNINNLLVAQRVGEDQFIGRNAGETRHQGLELDAKYILRLSETLVLSPYLSYTLNDHSFVDFVDEDNDFSGNPLTGVPKHRVSSGLTVHHTNGFRLNLTHQFVDEIPLTDANTLRSESFNVFHAKLNYRSQLGDHFSLGLNVGINNLFNTNYAQSVLINAVGFGGSLPRYFYPGNGRNYYGGLRLGYSL